jgi:hypothetical protein
VIVLNVELTPVGSVIIANLLVLFLSLYNINLVDHMSRDCPNPRTNGTQERGRRTERDTLSGFSKDKSSLIIRKSCCFE